jgi:hypothetical protein
VSLLTTWKNQLLLALILGNGRIQHKGAEEIEIVVLDQAHDERGPALDPFNASSLTEFPKHILVAVVEVGLFVIPRGLNRIFNQRGNHRSIMLTIALASSLEKNALWS